MSRDHNDVVASRVASPASGGEALASELLRRLVEPSGGRELDPDVMADLSRLQGLGYSRRPPPRL